MIPGAASNCLLNSSQDDPSLQIYSLSDQHHVLTSSSLTTNPNPENHHHHSSLLYNVSILKQKVDEIQSIVNVFISMNNQNQSDSSSTTLISSINPVIQEIITTASSMLLTCQQLSLHTTTGSINLTSLPDNNIMSQQKDQGFYYNDPVLDQSYDQYHSYDPSYNFQRKEIRKLSDHREEINDIIELDVAYLLAKYTHYCKVCEKGFKRDANLRMHMRAHGEEYKTTAALSNPMKNKGTLMRMRNKDCLDRKYSCPQEGCRWNRKHEKFQPLKSMICVKNHYKRSHCPKMYICKRCDRKKFSVLSDLRTHEKHCGNLKWVCSCGTTFSRKDKLMGHVGLFVGHTPVNLSSSSVILPKQGEVEH